MPDVRMPDGTLMRGVPETATKDEIMARYAKYQTSQQAIPQDSSIMQDVGNVAARTGRIATGIVGGALDLPSTVGQLAYDATRGAQANMGMQVAPEYKVPLPSEGLKGIYDMATNNAGKATGTAATMDKIAEIGAPLAGLATKVVPAVAKLAVPRVQGGAKQLAQRAIDFGIPLRIDQIAPSRATNTIQKISQEIPFSGVDASDAAQLQAWHKQAARMIGQDADNLSPEVIQKFAVDNGGKFNNVLSGTKITVDVRDVNRLKELKQLAKQNVGANSLSVVNSNLKQAMTDLTQGEMAGEKLANIRSYFLRNSVTADGGARKYIGKIIEAIDDIAARNIAPQKAQELSMARREYRNFKTMEPLLEKSTDGYINPTELISRVKANKYIKASSKKVGEDELVDLARIGKQFLVKKGGSDTAQKIAYMKAATAGVGGGGLGTAAVLNLPLAIKGAALATGGIAANRGLQALNQSPAAVQAALTGRSFNPNISNALAAIAAGAIMNKGE